MTKIPSDDILEGLYKLRIRGSEKLKTVLELYDEETHQKKLGPDYHRLKTYGEKKCRERFTKQEFCGQKRKFGSKRRGQESGNKTACTKNSWRFWQWESNGQCSKRDNCSFRHDINKRAKLTQPNPSPSSFMQQNETNASRTRSPRGKSPSGRMFRLPCKDYLKGTCTNSIFENGTLQNACSTRPRVVVGFGEKCSFAHRQVDEQPTKRSKKNDDKSAVAMLESTRQLGCVFHDMKPPKSISRKSSDMQKPIQRVKITKAIAPHTKIRETKILRME